MILRERNDQLLVIRQTDHAMLAGFFAREWGNEAFQQPEPFDSFCLAASEHDNGWTEWELAPELDPRTRQPYSFMSIPTPEHMALYQRGIDRVAQADPYAGLLVCLHCMSLYDRARATLPGFSAKYVKSNESQMVNDFVQGLRLQQLRLKLDLRANPATKAFTEEKALETNAAALQAVDRLSLYFCLNPLGEVTIDGVPLHEGGEDVDWELRSDAKQDVSLAPYPFRRSPLAVSILVRQVPKRMYGSDEDFQKALASAPYVSMNFTLHAADASNESPRSRNATA
jgi:hypothetical protein